MSKAPAASTAAEDAVLAHGSLACMRRLEDSLSCDICSDLFRAAASLDCGHTFCSFCIRQHIAQSNEQCPRCRSKAQASSIKPNSALQSAVAAYAAARTVMLEALSSRVQPTSAATAASSNRRGRSAGASELPAAAGRLADDGDDDDVIALDGADGAGAGAGASVGRGAMPPRPTLPDRMAPKVYNTMKDKQVKELCANLGLSGTGDRETLLYRHRTFTMLWNAGLDGIPRYDFDPHGHCRAAKAFSRTAILAETERMVGDWAKARGSRSAISKEQPRLFNYAASAGAGAGASASSGAGAATGQIDLTADDDSPETVNTSSAGRGASSSGPASSPSSSSGPGACPVNNMARVDASMQPLFARLKDEIMQRKKEKGQGSKETSSAAGGVGSSSAGASSSSSAADVVKSTYPVAPQMRVVWSDPASRPFYFDTEAGIGSFEHPLGCEATEAWIGLGKDGLAWSPAGQGQGQAASSAAAPASAGAGASASASSAASASSINEAQAAAEAAAAVSAAPAPSTGRGRKRGAQAVAPEESHASSAAAAQSDASGGSQRGAGASSSAAGATASPGPKRSRRGADDGRSTASAAATGSSSRPKADTGRTETGDSSAAGSVPAASSAPASSAAPVPPSSAAGWSCRVCTLVNRTRNKHCEACHTPRPA